MEEKKFKVLVIDDDPGICQLLKDALPRLGNYKVIDAKGGKMGSWLASCKWHRPDLVILDIMMPQVDGFEVLRRIRETKETAYIPVVILTGRTDAATKIRAEGLYCDDYIVKPLNLLDLKTRLEEVLLKRGLLERKKDIPGK